MLLAEKEKLLLEINKVISSLKKIVRKSKKSADKFKDASPSQSGDRLFFENTFYLNQSILKNMETLKQEVINSDDFSPSSVKPPCIITISFGNKKEQEFLFTQSSVNISNLKTITTNSPVGIALINKRVGEEFTYKIKQESNTQIIRGKILKIK